jgi:hypothetical protein
MYQDISSMFVENLNKTITIGSKKQRVVPRPPKI